MRLTLSIKETFQRRSADEPGKQLVSGHSWFGLGLFQGPSVR